jgi:hypothetical protein
MSTSYTLSGVTTALREFAKVVDPNLKATFDGAEGDNGAKKWINDALGIGGGDLGNLVSALVDAKGPTVYKGFRIYYVPTAEEILNRLVAGALAVKMTKEIGSEVTFQTGVEGATHVDQHALNTFLAYPPFSTVTSTGKAAWNTAVEAVKNKMVSRATASGSEPFNPANTLSLPGVFNKLPFPVGTPRKEVESGPSGYMLASSVPLAYTVAVARPGLRGGSTSAHAPLYPSVVMNGGAAPFAMYGGDSKSVANIAAKFVSMESQFERNSKKPLSAVLGAQIPPSSTPSVLAKKLGDDIDALVAAQTKLQNALLALSTAPYTPGTTFQTADYDKLAAAGAEINEKAAKVSRGWDKLSKIHDALEQLVAKTSQVALSGGLHNALKH